MIATLSANCGPHQVGGRTAQEEFSDSRVVNLIEASCNGDRDAIARSLKAGADPNGKGRAGDTPLFWALDCRNAVGMQALLEAGADPNYVIPAHFSATYAASGAEDTELLRLLLKFGGNPNASASDAPLETALGRAFQLGFHTGNWANYYALLDAGANINRGDDAGGTIATLAASFGQFDKVEELLKRGYDYDLVDLGAFVQPHSAHVAPARRRIMDMLEAKGVQFPIPARASMYSGRVTMRSDRSVYVVYWSGRTATGEVVHGRSENLKPGQPGYDEILRKVGGLRPGYGVGIPRTLE